MVVRVGYTERQAQRLKVALDKDMARIERAVAQMRVRVPDTDEPVEMALRILREAHDNLAAAVDRRTRQ